MEDTRPLGQLINCCSHLIRQYMDRQLRAYQVTPVQSFALIYLHRREGTAEVTQRDLERELRLKAPTVNGLVDRMAEKGFITRATSQTDGRCRVLALSEKGREAVETFQTAARRSEELIQAELSDRELQLLRELLTRLIANLENEVTKG